MQVSVIEQEGIVKVKDKDGNLYFLYPITKADLVDGLDELLHAKSDKKVPSIAGNAAGLDAGGNLIDLGNGSGDAWKFTPAPSAVWATR